MKEIDYLLFFAYSGIDNYTIKNYEKVLPDLISEDSDNQRYNKLIAHSIPTHGGPFENQGREFKPIIEILLSKLSQINDVIDYLVRLDRALNQNEHYYPRRRGIIFYWAKNSFEIFNVIRNNESYWGLIPDQFKGEIISAIGPIDTKIVELEWNELKNSLPNPEREKLWDLLYLLRSEEIPLKLKEIIISELIDSRNPIVLGTLLRNLKYLFPSEGKSNKYFEYSKLILELAELENEEFLECWGFHGAFGKLEGKQRFLTRKIIRDKLIKLPHFSDFHDKLLEFILPNVDNLVEFIESRSEIKNISVSRNGQIIEVNPFQYFQIPDEVLRIAVNSYEDFEKILLKLKRLRLKTGLESFERFSSEILNKVTRYGDPKLGLDNYYIKEFVENSFYKGAFDEALSYSIYLPKTEACIDLCLKIWGGNSSTSPHLVRSIINLWLYGQDRVTTFSANSLEKDIEFLESIMHKSSSSIVKQFFMDEINNLKNKLDGFDLPTPEDKNLGPGF